MRDESSDAGPVRVARTASTPRAVALLTDRTERVRVRTQWLTCSSGLQPDCEQSAGNVEAVEDVIRLAELSERKLGDSIQTRVTIEPCAIHDEAAWAARLPEASRLLFQSWKD